MARPAARKTQWTVMVYLAGDNNLDAAGTADLLEMKRVGSTDRVTLLAQFDRSGAGRATNRYLLRKNTPLADDVVTALGETDTGDPAILRDFVTWGAAQHPARHYLLVLWNHGSGWDDSNLYQGDYFSGAAPPVVRKGRVVARALVTGSPAPVRMDTLRAAARHGRRTLFRSTVAAMVSSRAIAFDDQAQDFLDNIELKRVLGQIGRALKRPIDLLGFDACLMSMVEVAYQVRGHVRISCGSEEEEPNDGWPYDTILEALAARPSMTPAQLAKLIVGRYVASYGRGEAATLAATDLAGIGAVADALDRLGRVLTAALKDEAARGQILAVRTQVQEYTAPYDQYCDVVDLCELLARRVRRPGLEAACRAVRAAVTKAVVASAAKGRGVAHSHGLTVYFPKKSVSRLYGTLDFARKRGWARFIDAYTASVARR